MWRVLWCSKLWEKANQKWKTRQIHVALWFCYLLHPVFLKLSFWNKYHIFIEKNNVIVKGMKRRTMILLSRFSCMNNGPIFYRFVVESSMHNIMAFSSIHDLHCQNAFSIKGIFLIVSSLLLVCFNLVDHILKQRNTIVIDWLLFWKETEEMNKNGMKNTIKMNLRMKLDNSKFTI